MSIVPTLVGAQGEALGTITGIVTPDETPPAHLSRIKRYGLQNVAGALLPGERVCWCGKRFIRGKNSVKVLYSPEHKAAHYGDLIVCGSPWICPVCAAKISERRRVELRKVLNKAKDTGLTPIMLTFTLQHHAGQGLGVLLDSLNDAVRRVKAGKGWGLYCKRFGLGHYVTALEVTYGQAGWHPHKHMLIFSTLKPGEIDYQALRGWVADRYACILAESGAYASDENGVAVSVGDTNAGDYVSKWGIDCELAKANTKQSRGKGLTPFQLLELSVMGENTKAIYPDLAWCASRSASLFIEYAQTLKGRQQLVYSRGARDYFGIGEEKTDEELAKQFENDAVILLFLTWVQWKMILKNDIRGEVLNAASMGKAYQVLMLLERYRIEVSDGQWNYALNDSKVNYQEYLLEKRVESECK